MKFKKQDNIDIWLCDLTYTQQTIASDIMPNAIGCIATYCKKNLKYPVNFELVKKPEELARWFFEKRRPKIIGFSNYAWNFNISMKFAEQIKRNYPEIIIVVGGPNYPLDLKEREVLVNKHNYVDYFISKEGENAFLTLTENLILNSFKKEKINEKLGSTDYINHQGKFIFFEKYAERIKDLNQIPSPYLEGYMDKFFDGIWLPIIQTNRGCPFTCTFCVEGGDFYTRVYKSSIERTKNELNYITQKMYDIPNNDKRYDLHIADSNFGMYKEDIDVCYLINELQAKFNFPEYINVATGKNQKKRVLQAAKLLNGALRLSGTVQTMDQKVLENIKRKNINLQELIELALKAKELNANTYSEIILGLPGDSLKAHLGSIEEVMNAEFNIVCLYQLMLLPGTDMGSPESRKKFGFKTAFRVLPRCYGSYDFLGDQINCAEIEEICISNNSLSFDEYLQARKMHLIINSFYNDGIFKEIFPFLDFAGIKKYDWLVKIYESQNDQFHELIELFLSETRKELFDSREEITEFIQSEEHIEEFLSGERGANLIFKYKLISISQYANTLYEVAVEAIKSLLKEKQTMELYPITEEVFRYCTMRMLHIFDLGINEIEDSFSFDIDKIFQNQDHENWMKYKYESPKLLSFVRSKEQEDLLRRYQKVYGTDTIALTRIISKVYVGKLLRQSTDKLIDRDELNQIGFGQSKLSGLNPFI